MCKTKIVTVVNNYEIFDNVVKNNHNLKDCEILAFDNRVEHSSISKKYNEFIENNLLQDCWIAFIHQDFGVMENLDNLLKTADKKCIYGVIGAKTFKGFFWGKRKSKGNYGFKTHLTLIVGEILQGNNGFNFRKYGHKSLIPLSVDSIDCCCVIMHSSLIKKYNLKFDENLKFHMYAEDICYRSKHEHKIKIKILPLKCFHLGKGNLNEEFQKSALYLKKKFNIKYIPSTCDN